MVSGKTGELLQKQKGKLVLDRGKLKTLVGPNGGVLAKLIPYSIGKKLIENLEESTKKLKKRKSTVDMRGAGQKFHLGFWRRRGMKETKLTSNSKLKCIRSWLKTNQPLFKKIKDIYKREFPGMFISIQFLKYLDLYESCYGITKKNKTDTLFGPFTCAAININFQSGLHIDNKDAEASFCWVIPFGDFEGGSLILPKLKVRIDLKPCDILCFQSHTFQHYVEKFIGIRNSLILFCDKYSFPPNENPKEKKRKRTQ